MARSSTLTEEIASKFEYYWRLVGDTMTDEQICHRLGIKFGSLRGWLQRNTRGRKANGERMELGMRDIRVRAKASTLTTYLSRLHQLLNAAEAANDFRTAATIVMWLAEKQFPKNYGNRPQTDVGDDDSHGVLLIDNRPGKDEWLQQSKQVHQQQKQQMDAM